MIKITCPHCSHYIVIIMMIKIIVIIKIIIIIIIIILILITIIILWQKVPSSPVTRNRLTRRFVRYASDFISCTKGAQKT